MTPAPALRLPALSAIWGASFLFMRLSAPSLAPTVLVVFRVGLAALFLAGVLWYTQRPFELRRNAPHYLILGLFNAAIPFTLFAFAAKTAPAALLAILNATAPLWAAIFGAVWTRTPLTPRTLLGLLLGIGGVALLAGIETLTLPAGAGLAVLAATSASASYGVATLYARSLTGIAPHANALGSMSAATLLLLPFAIFSPLPGELPSATVVLSVAALGVVCSGLAILMYYRLIAEIGAVQALTVTYLIPVFGILWGALFLGERIGWHTLAGSLAVLAGTALVTGFSPRFPPLFRASR